MHLVSDAMHIHRLLVGTFSASRLLGDHSKAHARLDLELHDFLVSPTELSAEFIPCLLLLVFKGIIAQFLFKDAQQNAVTRDLVHI